jgi:transcription elongation factor GreA
VREVRDKLLEEVQALERELRIDLPREIKTALAMGDLRENAEYHAALERQAFVKARIGQLRQRLTELNNMQMGNIPTDRAGLGSTVTLLDLDSKEELAYEIVLPEVADSARGRLSIASPIGRGLVDKKEGDEVVIVIPSGRRRFEVLGVRTIHDKDNGGRAPEAQGD